VQTANCKTAEIRTSPSFILRFSFDIFILHSPFKWIGDGSQSDGFAPGLAQSRLCGGSGAAAGEFG
jgi:hypothetical protein